MTFFRQTMEFHHLLSLLNIYDLFNTLFLAKFIILYHKIYDSVFESSK